jgi:hypothetical protein
MAEPLKATFFAFRKRERRGVLWRATLAHAAFLLICAVAGAVMNVASLSNLLGGGGGADPGAAGLWLATLGTAIVVYFMTMASYEAACLRWLVRGEVKGFGGVSLDADMVRVWLGQWLWFLITVPLLVVASLITAIAFEVFRVGVSGSSQEGATFFALWVVVSAPVALRLAPANAASVGRRKFAYFDAWSVTRERFRALGGSFLVVWLIWAACMIVVFFGLGMLVFALTGGDRGRAPLISGLMFGVMLLTVVIANMVAASLLAGVNARAVLAAARESKIEGVATPDDVAEVFA